MPDDKDGGEGSGNRRPIVKKSHEKSVENGAESTSIDSDQKVQEGEGKMPGKGEKIAKDHHPGKGAKQLPRSKTSGLLPRADQAQRRFREMIGKRELKNEELGRHRGDLRQRLDLLECSVPAVMVWNIWRMAQGAPVSSLPRLIKNQFTGQAFGEAYCPCSTPSRHYDCRVREAEADRKQAEKKALEARNLLTEKLTTLESKKQKLEEAKKIQQERQEKIKQLTQQAKDLKEALRSIEANEGSCEVGECGDIQCKQRWLGTMSSSSSIKSTDVDCLEKLQVLAETELAMKKQIEDLERREESYMKSLQQADELWTKMEGDTASSLSVLQEQLDSKIAENRKLADHIAQLEDDLEDLRSKAIAYRTELEKFMSVEKIEATIGRDDDLAQVADRSVAAKVKMRHKITGRDDDVAAVGDKEISAIPTLSEVSTYSKISKSDKMSTAKPDSSDLATHRQSDLINMNDVHTATRSEDFTNDERFMQARMYLDQLGSLSRLDDDDDYEICDPEYNCQQEFSETEDEQLISVTSLAPRTDGSFHGRTKRDVGSTPTPRTKGKHPEQDADYRENDRQRSEASLEVKFADPAVDHKASVSQPGTPRTKPLRSILQTKDSIRMIKEQDSVGRRTFDEGSGMMVKDPNLRVQSSIIDQGPMSPTQEQLSSWLAGINATRATIAKCPDCHVALKDLEDIAQAIASYTGEEVKIIPVEDLPPRRSKSATKEGMVKEKIPEAEVPVDLSTEEDPDKLKREKMLSGLIEGEEEEDRKRKKVSDKALKEKEELDKVEDVAESREFPLEKSPTPKDATAREHPAETPPTPTELPAKAVLPIPPATEELLTELEHRLKLDAVEEEEQLPGVDDASELLRISEIKELEQSEVPKIEEKQADPEIPMKKEEIFQEMPLLMEIAKYEEIANEEQMINKEKMAKEKEIAIDQKVVKEEELAMDDKMAKDEVIKVESIPKMSEVEEKPEDAKLGRVETERIPPDAESVEKVNQWSDIGVISDEKPVDVDTAVEFMKEEDTTKLEDEVKVAVSDAEEDEAAMKESDADKVEQVEVHVSDDEKEDPGVPREEGREVWGEVEETEKEVDSAEISEAKKEMDFEMEMDEGEVLRDKVEIREAGKEEEIVSRLTEPGEVDAHPEQVEIVKEVEAEEAELTEAQLAEPQLIESPLIEPPLTEPQFIEPGPTEPQTIESQLIEPAPTEPLPIESQFIVPEPIEPEQVETAIEPKAIEPKEKSKERVEVSVSKQKEIEEDIQEAMKRDKAAIKASVTEETEVLKPQVDKTKKSVAKIVISDEELPREVRIESIEPVPPKMDKVKEPISKRRKRIDDMTAGGEFPTQPSMVDMIEEEEEEEEDEEEEEEEEAVGKPLGVIDPQVARRPYLAVADIEGEEPEVGKAVPCSCRMPETHTAAKDIIKRIPVTRTQVVEKETVEILTQTSETVSTQTIPVKKLPAHQEASEIITFTEFIGMKPEIRETRAVPKGTTVQDQSTITVSSVGQQTEIPETFHETKPGAHHFIPSPIGQRAMKPPEVTRGKLEKELRSINYTGRPSSANKVECLCCSCGKAEVPLKISPRLQPPPREVPLASKMPIMLLSAGGAKPRAPKSDQETRQKNLCMECIMKRLDQTKPILGERKGPERENCKPEVCAWRITSGKIHQGPKKPKEKKDQTCMADIPKPKPTVEGKRRRKDSETLRKVTKKDSKDSKLSSESKQRDSLEGCICSDAKSGNKVCRCGESD